MQRGFNAFLGGKIDAQRVDELLVLIQFKMEMRAGRSAGRTYVADDLSFGDAHPAADSGGEALQMGIAACVRGIVLDINGFSVVAVPAGFANDTVADGTNRSASLSGKIHAHVRQIGL